MTQKDRKTVEKWVATVIALFCLTVFCLTVGFWLLIPRPRHHETLAADVVQAAEEAGITVVAPEVAARNGGWVSWPTREDMTEKSGHWAVFLCPIQPDGSPIYTDPATLATQDEIFTHYYPPIKGSGDGWMIVRQRWLIGEQLCEARYFRRSEHAFTPIKLFNQVGSEVAIELAPNTD